MVARPQMNKRKSPSLISVRDLESLGRVLGEGGVKKVGNMSTGRLKNDPMSCTDGT